MEPMGPWGEDEFEITRDVQLECDTMDISDEYCGWDGTLTLDGFEYMGTEYYQWACPSCGTAHTEEDKVR